MKGCKVGDEDWIGQKYELHKHSLSLNCQTTKVMRTISITEHFSIELTKCQIAMKPINTMKYTGQSTVRLHHHLPHTCGHLDQRIMVVGPITKLVESKTSFTLVVTCLKQIQQLVALAERDPTPKGFSRQDHLHEHLQRHRVGQNE